jgi:hypothetical protein
VAAEELSQEGWSAFHQAQACCEDILPTMLSCNLALWNGLAESPFLDLRFPVSETGCDQGPCFGILGCVSMQGEMKDWVSSLWTNCFKVPWHDSKEG